MASLPKMPLLRKAPSVPTLTIVLWDTLDMNDVESRKTIRVSLPVRVYAILSFRAAMAEVTVADYVATTMRLQAIPKQGEPGHVEDIAEIVGQSPANSTHTR